MGLVVGGNYVWCLVIVFIFMRFGQAKAQRCGGRFKVINWGGYARHKERALFIGKRVGEGGFALCNIIVL